jgi:hypothetical protein
MLAHMPSRWLGYKSVDTVGYLVPLYTSSLHTSCTTRSSQHVQLSSPRPGPSLAPCSTAANMKPLSQTPCPMLMSFPHPSQCHASQAKN